VAHAPDPPDGIAELRRPPPPRTWRERIEQVADATGTTPARVLLGGLAAVGAVLAGLWVTRPPAPPPEVALPFASTTVPAAVAPSTTTTGALLVHVAGAVAFPGVHELPAGSRVVDALEVAGGLAPDADSGRLNLAAPVHDGERVYVLHQGEAGPPPVAGDSTGTGASGGESAAGPIDLNTADEAALDALPGVGPATAAAIVAHRQQIGRFTSVDQLLDVRGIGTAKLEALRDLVQV
jgi:competence protein ComEA